VENVTSIESLIEVLKVSKKTKSEDFETIHREWLNAVRQGDRIRVSMIEKLIKYRENEM